MAENASRDYGSRFSLNCMSDFTLSRHNGTEDRMNLHTELNDDTMKLDEQVKFSLCNVVSSVLTHPKVCSQVVKVTEFWICLMQVIWDTENEEHNTSTDTRLLPAPIDTEELLTHSVSVCPDNGGTVCVQNF